MKPTGSLPPDQATRSEVNTTYYGNGEIKHRGAYLDGEMHGPWEFYRLDGSLMRAGSLDRGRQVGIWRTHDRAGRVVSVMDFGV